MGCCEKKKPETINENTVPLNSAYQKPKITEEGDTNTNPGDDEGDHVLNVKVSYKDFKPLKLLGRGSFGEVLLVRLIATNKVYAMKILDKNMLKQRKPRQRQNEAKAEGSFSK